jgi:hypothetical protein
MERRRLTLPFSPRPQKKSLAPNPHCSRVCDSWIKSRVQGCKTCGKRTMALEMSLGIGPGFFTLGSCVACACMRGSFTTVVLGFALLACEPPGRRRPPTQVRAETWTAPARTDQQIAGVCHAAVKAEIAKLVQRHRQAERELEAADERLRAVQELGDAPTILQAMKDRDAAAFDVSATEVTKAERKQRYFECKQSTRAQDTQARLHQLKTEREARERREAARAAEEQAEEDDAADRRRAALRALGEGLQRIGASQPASPPPTYTAPSRVETPVDRCNQCIQQWCSFECSGIGNTCAPCMKRWCDFEC